MTAILRVEDARVLSKSAAPIDPAKDYIDRLIKLIPAEVIGLYLLGKGLILERYPLPLGQGERQGELWFWMVWTAFCFAAVIAVRTWATRDPHRNIPTEWPAVAIAAASFLIWVFCLGDVFLVAGWWDSLVASLLVLGWTFIVPVFYRERVIAELPPVPDAGGGSAEAGDSGPFESVAPTPMGTTAVTGTAAAAFAPFTLFDAERAVLDASSGSGARPHSTDKVAKRYDTEHAFLNLLGAVQTLLKERHGITIPLRQVDAKTSKELRGKTYGHVADWVFRSVREAKTTEVAA